jgi:hypothetical protein
MKGGDRGFVADRIRTNAGRGDRDHLCGDEARAIDDRERNDTRQCWGTCGEAVPA